MDQEAKIWFCEGNSLSKAYIEMVAKQEFEAFEAVRIQAQKNRRNIFWDFGPYYSLAVFPTRHEKAKKTNQGSLLGWKQKRKNKVPGNQQMRMILKIMGKSYLFQVFRLISNPEIGNLNSGFEIIGFYGKGLYEKYNKDLTKLRMGYFSNV